MPSRWRRAGAVTDLHGELEFGAVQHGLAVEADNGHVGACEAVAFEEELDRFGRARVMRSSAFWSRGVRVVRSVSSAPSFRAARSSARSSSL